MENNETRNRSIVGGIYEAFGCGDVPAILDQMADDVAWESWPDNSAQKAGVPWMLGGIGKAAVTGFFQAISTWIPNDFQVKGLMSGGDTVVAEIEADFTIGARRLADCELHLWRFNEAGKVSFFRHYIDTARHIAVAK